MKSWTSKRLVCTVVLLACLTFVWASSTAAEEPSEPPNDSVTSVSYRWLGVLGAYSPGEILGEQLRKPVLVVEIPGNPEATISLYEGVSGDVSNPLGSHSFSAGMSHYRVDVPSLLLTETTSVWARILWDGGQEDTETLPIVVVQLDQTPVFRRWPGRITSVDAGAFIRLRTEVEPDSAVLNYKWYWGESGDTSSPMQSLSPADARLSFCDIVVPTGIRSFWVQVIGGASMVDSPTATIEPLPLSLPRIIDQPDDGTFTTRSGDYVSASIVVTGGALKYQWYRGKVGDTSRKMVGVEGTGGNGLRRNFAFLFEDLSSDSFLFWGRVSNQFGSVDTRQVTFRRVTVDDFLLTPLRRVFRMTRRLQDKIENRGWRNDAIRFSCTEEANEMELLRIGDDAETLIARVALGFPSAQRGSFLPRSYSFDEASTDLADLPSGRYRVRFYFEENSSETEDFIWINELLDPAHTLVRSTLDLLSRPGSRTEGGTVSVILQFPTDYVLDSFELLGVRNGEWRALDYEIEGENFISSDDPPGSQRSEMVWVRWQPNASPFYWASVLREDGERAVVRIPGVNGEVADPADWEESPYEMVLPEGVEEIPLPELPGGAEWYLGGDGDGGSGFPVSLPFTMSNLMEPRAKLYPLGQSAIPAPVEISVEGNLPPMLIDPPSQLVVSPAGQVLWSGRVEGDVFETRISASADGESFQKVHTYVGLVTDRFHLPSDARKAELEWDADGRVCSWSGPVQRIPSEFEEGLGIEFYFHDTAVSGTLGALLDLRSYPWTFHGELGWTYLRPAPVGFHFFGLLADNGGGWYWTSPDVYPFIYSFRTSSWEYYLTNSYGWIYNFGEGAWRKVAL